MGSLPVITYCSSSSYVYSRGLVFFGRGVIRGGYGTISKRFKTFHRGGRVTWRQRHLPHIGKAIRTYEKVY